MVEVLPAGEPGGAPTVTTRPPKRWEVVFYRVVRGLIAVATKIWFRIDVVGTEHIPADRPFVLAPVHRSNIDFALASLVTKRRMRYIAKDSLFKIGWLGKIWLALGAFPVHRGSADREALRTSISVVQSGQPLVLFPEGTRQSGPVVDEVFDGAAYVAARTAVQIVPVGIGGSERAMPKGAKFIKPMKIVIVIGAPMDPPVSGERGRSSRRAVRETTAQLKVEIQRLFDDAQLRAGSV
jgi:1-acyl-sn-glycerol-3-phosphate acyltransferase